MSERVVAEQQAVARSPLRGAALKERYTGAAEALRFEVDATVCLALIWALLLGALGDWIPAWLLVLTPLLYARFELAGHELLHCRTGRQVNWLLRHMPVAQSVYSLNYDGYRAHHLAHHRHLGTEHDPENYLIRTGAWRSLFKAMFAIEVVDWQWIRTHKLGVRFWIDFVLRAALFAALLAWNWPVFLLYLVCLRVGVGFAEFFFHYCLHTENNPVFRVFRFVADRCPWLFVLLLGRNKLPILLCHNEHHTAPMVAARHLPEMTPQLVPDPHLASSADSRDHARLRTQKPK